MMQFLLMTVEQASRAVLDDEGVDIVQTLRKGVHTNIMSVRSSGGLNQVSLHIKCFTWALLTFFLQAEQVANVIFAEIAKKTIDELCQVEILLQSRFQKLCRGTNHALRRLCFFVFYFLTAVNNLVPLWYIIASSAGVLQDSQRKLKGTS